jgi:hypothetical protein
MKTKNRVLSIAALLVAVPVFAFAISGCSAVLEATRPDPVNLDPYVMGSSRDQVRASLGAPESTTPQGQYSCDNYELVVRGPNGWQKGGIIVGEVAVDALTLGIAEIVTTPAEMATRNGTRNVSFCYGENNLLAMRSY